jgi:hypothetical protein
MNEKSMVEISTKIKNCNNIYYLMQHMGQQKFGPMGYQAWT